MDENNDLNRIKVMLAEKKRLESGHTSFWS